MGGFIAAKNHGGRGVSVIREYVDSELKMWGNGE